LNNYQINSVNATPVVRSTLLNTLDTQNLDAFIFPTVNTFARSAFGTTDPTFVNPPGTSAPVRQVEFASSSGLPDITVPAGFGQLGLPFTISFTGRPYDESTLLGLAYAFEQETRFRRPSPLLAPLAGETILVPEPDAVKVLIGLGITFCALGMRRRQNKSAGN
jgi:amidase